MFTSSETKVVQPRLPASEYERLREVAEQEKRPLKEVLRDAARAYTDSRMAPDPDDPLFTAELPPGDGPTVSAADADEFLYGDGPE